MFQFSAGGYSRFLAGERVKMRMSAVTWKAWNRHLNVEKLIGLEPLRLSFGWKMDG